MSRRTAHPRRWHRLVLPFAVLGLLVAVTLVARASQEPDLRDPGTLAPAATGPDGSSRLAARLADRGVAVEPVSDLAAARQALRRGGDAVLFVPKPTPATAVLVRWLARGSTGHRVVLVAPDRFQLAHTGLPVGYDSRRWAAAATAPACSVPEAVAAGVTAALQHRYVTADPGRTCYDGGLAYTAAPGGAEVFVVGATDPFRNRRIGEHGNAELALGLLAARDRVVWADALPLPPADPVPELDRDIREPDGPSRGELDRDGGNAFAGLVAGYPPGVLAGLVLAAVVAVLLALARGRRFGPPATEPLPVRVPATEAVVGQGRLYQRGRGRAPAAFAALRDAALPRLAAAAGLPARPEPEPAALVAAVAARTGWPAAQVHETLYGADPGSDEELGRAVAALDALVARATGTGEEQP